MGGGRGGTSRIRLRVPSKLGAEPERTRAERSGLAEGAAACLLLLLQCYVYEGIPDVSAKTMIDLTYIYYQ